MKNFVIENVGVECDVEKAKIAIENFKIELEEDIGEVIVKKLQLENIEDAKEYLEDIFSGSPVAVRYMESISTFDKSEKYKDISEKINKLENDIENYAQDIFGRLKEQKSSKKGCDNCQSNISRIHFIKNIEDMIEDNSDEEPYNLKLEDLKCPICGNKDFVTTDGDTKKLEKMQEKLQELKEKLITEKKLYDVKHSEKIVNILIMV
jgi:rubrerythrin